MELTKEYFDQQLDRKLDQKLENFVTKEYFNQQLHKALNKKLEKFITKEYFDQKINVVQSDIRFLQSDVLEIKRTVERHNERNIQDGNAFASTLVQHNERISNLERTSGVLRDKSSS